jgi:hypothetical protein
MSAKILHMSLVRLPHVKNEPRNKTPKKRSIILPEDVWAILEKDAERCLRTVNRQVEAIFSRYYDLVPDVELNEEKLAETSKSMAHAQRKAG